MLPEAVKFAAALFSSVNRPPPEIGPVCKSVTQIKAILSGDGLCYRERDCVI